MTSCIGIKNSSKKIIITHFINRNHAEKALISKKNHRKYSSSNCNVFINENLTVKSNEITFLGRKLKHSGHFSYQLYICKRIYIDGYIYIYTYIYKFESHLMMCCTKQKLFKNIYSVKYFAFFTEASSTSVMNAKHFNIYIYIY